MTLVRRSKDQISLTPRDSEEWAMERARNRGVSLQELAGLDLPTMSNARARILAEGPKKKID
jgi:hypothetical protein